MSEVDDEPASIDFGATFENWGGWLGDLQRLLYALGIVSDYGSDRCDSDELDCLNDVESAEECLKGIIADLRTLVDSLEDIVTNDKANVARLDTMMRQVQAARQGIQ